MTGTAQTLAGMRKHRHARGCVGWRGRSVHGAQELPVAICQHTEWRPHVRLLRRVPVSVTRLFETQAPTPPPSLPLGNSTRGTEARHRTKTFTLPFCILARRSASRMARSDRNFAAQASGQRRGLLAWAGAAMQGTCTLQRSPDVRPAKPPLVHNLSGDAPQQPQLRGARRRRYTRALHCNGRHPCRRNLLHGRLVFAVRCRNSRRRRVAVGRSLFAPLRGRRRACFSALACRRITAPRGHPACCGAAWSALGGGLLGRSRRRAPCGGVGGTTYRNARRCVCICTCLSAAS